MPTIFKSSDRDFRENPGRIDRYRLVSDFSIIDKGLKTNNLNFDLRRLDPGQYSSLHHSHRHAEELFLILSGTATLRTPEGLTEVREGDLLFFEAGDSGAHQLHNAADEPCIYLDVRTFMGSDVVDYPDSNRVLLVPSMECFRKEAATALFDGEENPDEIWAKLKNEE
jgi:uncharacterized cupin superfamily protein